MKTDDVDAGMVTLRIIVAGMAAGLLLFGGAAFAVGPLVATPDPAFEQILLGAVAVVTVANAVAFTVLRAAKVRGLATRRTALRTSADPARELLGDYRNLVLIRSGLCEAPGFFALIIYMLTGQRLALVVAGGALLALVAAFPSREALQGFAREVTGSPL